jgi:hypothetical protein
MIDESMIVDPELMAEYAKVEAVNREQGIIPIEERRAALLQALTTREQLQRYKELEAELAPLETEIRSLPEIERLQQLPQLGGKYHPTNFAYDLSQPVVMVPIRHTRYNHSELLAEMIKVAGVRLGLPTEEIKAMITAAWMHDMGHSAFSHMGDELLKERGWPDHEERAIEKIQRGPILELLRNNQIKPHAVIELVREKDGLGSLQSALDTLSYLTLDTAALRRPEYKDSGARVIADIQGIDRKADRLIVGNQAVWQELMELRAVLLHELTYDPRNKVTDEAKRQLLRLAILKNYVTAEDIVSGTDGALALKLQSLVVGGSAIAELAGRRDAIPHLGQYHHLYDAAFGIVDNRVWHERRFDSKSEALSFLGQLAPKAIEQSFMWEPYDYTAKEIKLVVNRGESYDSLTIQAKDTQPRPEDKDFIVYYPKPDFLQ